MDYNTRMRIIQMFKPYLEDWQRAVAPPPPLLQLKLFVTLVSIDLWKVIFSLQKCGLKWLRIKSERVKIKIFLGEQAPGPPYFISPGSAL